MIKRERNIIMSMMRSMGRVLQQFVLVFAVTLILLELQYNHRANADEYSSNQFQLAKPGCSATCGSLVIPYPFGTTPRCYLNENFFISCNSTNKSDSGNAGGSPKAFLGGRRDFVILNISLERQEMRISRSMNKLCFYIDEHGYETWGTDNLNRTDDMGLLPDYFRISSRLNKFTTVGCNTFGVIRIIDGSDSRSPGSEDYESYEGYNKPTMVSSTRLYSGGCVTSCTQGIKNLKVNETCDPLNGCCQIPISIDDVRSYKTSLGSALVPDDTYDTRIARSHGMKMVAHQYYSCGYAFITDEEDFKFSSSDIVPHLENRKTAPLVLDWAVRNYNNCAEVRSKHDRKNYACVGKHSVCLNSTNGPGYTCKCRRGFQGNPYLHNGCQDIDECASEQFNPCLTSAKCINTDGGAFCLCPKKFIGDGKKTGSGCTSRANLHFKIIVIALGLCTALLMLIIISFYICWEMKRRRLIKLRRMFFEQNGGILLQQHLNLSRHKPSLETMKIFTSDELKKATNNFDQSKVLGQGANGTVYKGVLKGSDQLVAIKKSKSCDRSQIGEFINEGIVLSQVNHRNVVKLLGCCLESEVPLLVYEFITNGTLSSHLHLNRDTPFSITLSWQMRLRIASEIAGALAYLHSQTYMPILHRDVKSCNILLDDNFTAKVADFGASRLVPLGQTQLTTLLQGTIGYLDPEYLYSSQLTEKSDVYSFGVILAELLTGKKPVFFEEQRETTVNLAVHFVSCVEEECLQKILDNQMTIDDEIFEVLKELANVAVMCLRLKREERPTMKGVAAKLEVLSTAIVVKT